jgi:hypothetical protein
LEDFRNWNKTQDWMLNKQRDIYGNEDPDTIALNEKLAGIGTADMGMLGSSVGGLAAMLRASHGSPHLFNKFDFSKIGTGEGAQAYGHGGYFAQGFDSPVAKRYAEELANINQNTGYSTAHLNAQHQVKKFGNDPEWAAEVVADTMKNFDPKDPQYASLADTLKLIQSGDYAKPLAHEGHLYNVELKWPDAAREAADPLGEHHLLDWDAPLSKQPKGVRSAFNELVNSPEGQKLAEEYWSHKPGLKLSDLPEWNDVSGEAIYKNALGSGSWERANELLQKHGIPGIRYLDQGSRGAGTGSRNYVMFDDRIPNIVSRNGVSLTDLLRR